MSNRTPSDRGAIGPRSDQNSHFKRGSTPTQVTRPSYNSYPSNRYQTAVGTSALTLASSAPQQQQQPQHSSATAGYGLYRDAGHYQVAQQAAAQQTAAGGGERRAADYRPDDPTHHRRRPSMLQEFHHSQSSGIERHERSSEPYRYGGYISAQASSSGTPSSRDGQAGHAIIPDQKPAEHGPFGANKRPRLSIDTHARPELSQPLKIDTTLVEPKKEPGYHPQVEAISPTLPSEENKLETALMRSSKEELLQSISKVDREISKVESQITKLKKKQQQLEEDAARPPEEKESPTEPSSEPKLQSVAQIIYAENRKKAEMAHATLSKLGSTVDLPLYNQPSDTAIYHENIRSFQTFKKRLILHFKRRHQAARIRERYLTERYDQLMQVWLKKMEKVENSAKRRAKDVKQREFYEKIFPEIKKAREDRERFTNRVGSRGNIGGYARSEAELEQIMDGLHEQEEEDKKMRSYAVVPPMMLDARQRRYKFINTNGRIEDPMAEYKERQLLNVWSETEKEIFKEKFLQHPKNFGLIASYLERKSVSDCIHYYYLTKKNENYKQLLRKQNVKARRRQLQKQQQQASNNNTAAAAAAAAAASISTATTATTLTAASSAAGGTTTTTSTSSTSSTGTSGVGTAQTTDKHAAGTTDQNHAATANVQASADASLTTPANAGSLPSHLTINAGVAIKKEPTTTTGAAPSGAATTASAGAANNDGTPIVATGGAANNKPGANLDVMDSELSNAAVADIGGVHQCAVCKTSLEHYGLSRPLTKSNCDLYGLGDVDLEKEDLRVCSSCRCRSVRKRCPVPTCKTPKRKVKRLRPFPAKWGDLPDDVRDAVIKDLQLTTEINKCCSACFNRITRKLGNHVQSSEAGYVTLADLAADNSQDGAESSRWSDEEINIAKDGLRKHGQDWAAISRLVATKTEAQCKNFYFNYRKKFSLDTLVMEYRRERPSTESRTASVCESTASTVTAPSDVEMSSDDHDDDDDGAPDSEPGSDTDSVPTPEKMDIDDEVTSLSTSEKKCDDDNGSSMSRAETGGFLPSTCGTKSHVPPPDYDSSATLSADEGPHTEIGVLTASTDLDRNERKRSIDTPERCLPDGGQSGPLTPDRDTERRGSLGAPACIRDLIHSAIERNLTSSTQVAATPTITNASIKDDLVMTTPSNMRTMPTIPTWPVNQPSSGKSNSRPPSRPLSQGPLTGNTRPASNPASGVAITDKKDYELQDLTFKVDPVYKGDPRDFAPRETRPFERQDDGKRLGIPPPAHVPPPAHAHHFRNERHHDSGKTSPQDRCSQSTPPALRTSTTRSSSPYAPSARADSRPGAAIPGPRHPIPPPPPLITSKTSPKIPIKTEKLSPLVSPSPTGSITHGTPVGHPVIAASNAARYDGSISLGTPRYEGLIRQATPPQSRQEGSISKGTPVADPRTGAAYEGVRLAGTTVYDGLGRGVVYSDNLTRPVIYDRALEHMYNLGRARMSPSGAYYPAVAFQAQYNDASAYSSSRATIMGDFFTAQQMQQAQDFQRRAGAHEKEPHLSPRTREASKAYPGGVIDGVIHPGVTQMTPYGTLATPQGMIYLPHPGQVVSVDRQVHPGQVVGAVDRNVHSSPVPRDTTSPRGEALSSSSSWPQQKASHSPSPRSVSGNPPRQNVIQHGMVKHALLMDKEKARYDSAHPAAIGHTSSLASSHASSHSMTLSHAGGAQSGPPVARHFSSEYYTRLQQPRDNKAHVPRDRSRSDGALQVNENEPDRVRLTQEMSRNQEERPTSQPSANKAQVASSRPDSASQPRDGEEKDPASKSTSFTAANLIEMIITHQIIDSDQSSQNKPINIKKKALLADVTVTSPSSLTPAHTADSQKSPGYKPHKAALSRYEAELASSQDSSSKDSDAPICIDVDSPAATARSGGDQANNSVAGGGAGGNGIVDKNITLGDHIDAIIIQNYTHRLPPAKGKGGPNAGYRTAMSSDMGGHDGHVTRPPPTDPSTPVIVDDDEDDDKNRVVTSAGEADQSPSFRDWKLKKAVSRQSTADTTSGRLSAGSQSMDRANESADMEISQSEAAPRSNTPPAIGGYDVEPISPASSSESSCNNEAKATRIASPRASGVQSPRCGATSVSHLAAQHQAITTLLTKQPGYQSDGISKQHSGSVPQISASSSSGEKQGVTPLEYVRSKISQVIMENEPSGSRKDERMMASSMYPADSYGCYPFPRQDRFSPRPASRGHVTSQSDACQSSESRGEKRALEMSRAVSSASDDSRGDDNASHHKSPRADDWSRPHSRDSYDTHRISPNDSHLHHRTSPAYRTDFSPHDVARHSPRPQSRDSSHSPRASLQQAMSSGAMSSPPVHRVYSPRGQSFSPRAAGDNHRLADSGADYRQSACDQSHLSHHVPSDAAAASSAVTSSRMSPFVSGAPSGYYYNYPMRSTGPESQVSARMDVTRSRGSPAQSTTVTPSNRAADNEVVTNHYEALSDED